MKFTLGDSTDGMLVRSMSDEMAKCESAWRSFEMLAGPNVHGLKGAQKPSHDAYVRCLHHLYEFYLSAICRDAQDTDWDKRGPSKKPHEAHDQRIASEALRCVNSKIHSIEHDYAPVSGHFKTGQVWPVQNQPL